MVKSFAGTPRGSISRCTSTLLLLWVINNTWLCSCRLIWIIDTLKPREDDMRVCYPNRPSRDFQKSQKILLDMSCHRSLALGQYSSIPKTERNFVGLGPRACPEWRPFTNLKACFQFPCGQDTHISVFSKPFVNCGIQVYRHERSSHCYWSKVYILVSSALIFASGRTLVVGMRLLPDRTALHPRTRRPSEVESVEHGCIFGRDISKRLRK